LFVLYNGKQIRRALPSEEIVWLLRSQEIAGKAVSVAIKVM
jgi:hypothetical protein